MLRKQGWEKARALIYNMIHLKKIAFFLNVPVLAQFPEYHILVQAQSKY